MGVIAACCSHLQLNKIRTWTGNPPSFLSGSVTEHADSSGWWHLCQLPSTGEQPSAGRLYDRLADRFGEGQVLIDVDAIELGVDFAEEISRAVAACKVLLAIIGPTWLTATDERGHRRLDDPDDIVRLEIEAALARNVRVIPILVEGAVMPNRQDLPEGLAGLSRRNALLIRHESLVTTPGAWCGDRAGAGDGTPHRRTPQRSPGSFRSTGNAVGEVAQQDPAPARNDPVNLETEDALLRQLYPDRGILILPTYQSSWKKISLGYTSLDLLKNVLEQADEALRRDEQANPPGRDMKPGTKYYI